MAMGFLLIDSGWSAGQAGVMLTFAATVSQGIFELLEQASSTEEMFVGCERINRCESASRTPPPVVLGMHFGAIQTQRVDRVELFRYPNGGTRTHVWRHPARRMATGGQDLYPRFGGALFRGFACGFAWHQLGHHRTSTTPGYIHDQEEL